MLFFEDVQNSESRGAGNGIAAEGTEEFHAVVEACGDFRSGDDCRERESISDRFAEHHDVGNDVLRFEAPEVRAEAAEADLHFVGDADTARGADVLVGFARDSPGGKTIWPATLGSVSAMYAATLRPCARSVLQNLGDVLRVFCSSRGVVSPVRTAIVVGNRRHVDPRFAAAASRAIKFVRADVDERGCVAVIGVFEDDHVFAAGVGARKAKRQFVRFAAGIHEIADAQRLRQRRVRRSA